MAKKATRSRQIPFDREKHVYKNDAFVELIKDAVRFFNGTPVHPLPPVERFVGTGIYAIYYTGEADPYRKYAKLNRLAYDYPIYVGKAVPKVGVNLALRTMSKSNPPSFTGGFASTPAVSAVLVIYRWTTFGADS